MRLARVWLLVAALAAGCYRSHARDAGAADAGPLDAGRVCGCPGDPRAEVCALPEMCCPGTRTCEDPAHFRCTGSVRRCP